MKPQDDPVAEYRQILKNRSQWPPKKANALVPRQEALEEIILKAYGIGAFGGLLRDDDLYVVVQAAFVILEKHNVEDDLRHMALKCMKMIAAKKSGNESFSAHHYLKRKGLLDPE